MLGVSSLKTASSSLKTASSDAQLSFCYVIVVLQKQLLTVSASGKLLEKNSRKSAISSRAHGQRDVAPL